MSTVEEKPREAEEEEQGEIKEELRPYVPMPKLEERAKPKKRKVLRTRIEEAGAGKGE